MRRLVGRDSVQVAIARAHETEAGLAAVPALRKAFYDRDALVRKAASEALKKILQRHQRPTELP
jgi:HEAT repeat protein